MGRWKEIRVSEIGPVFSGSTPSTSSPEFWDGEYVWITPADLSMVDIPFVNSSSRKLTWLGVKKATNGLLPENCVLISCRAPVGYCAVVSCDFSFNQGCKAIMPYGKYNSLYLYYYLKMYKRSLERVSSGTTFLELPKRELDRFKINIPQDDKEQSKIAEILSAIDIVIEKNRAIVEKYQSIKTGMMQDLLANGIDENGNIRSPKIHKYKDSPIGKMPVEWEYGFLSDLAYINPKTSINVPLDEEVDFIPMQAVSEDGVWNIKETKIAKDCIHGFTEFIENDILFAKITPCMENGKGCIVKNLKNVKGFGSTEFHILRPKSNSIPDFIYYWTISYYLRNKAIAYMSGSAGQQRVNSQFFDKFEIGKPPKDEQCLIANKLSAIDIKIQSEQAYLKKLQRIKQGLMQDLLTHRVAVDRLL
jgi:type I restriction enzyme S subunit